VKDKFFVKRQHYKEEQRTTEKQGNASRIKPPLLPQKKTRKIKKPPSEKKENL